MTRRSARDLPLHVTIDQVSPDAANALLASLVTDDGETVTVPLNLLPEGSRAGDVLTVRFQRDAGETRVRKQRVADLQKRLFGSGFEP